MISKSLDKRPKVCKIKQGICKKMLRNFMITPTLWFKQQQIISQSHFFPYRYSLGKKVGQLKINAASFLRIKLKKSGKIWKELEQTIKMWPTRTFLVIRLDVTAVWKWHAYKINRKTAAFFVISDPRFLISWLKLAAIFKQFKIGGLDWAYFLSIFKIFPGIMIFF